MSDNLLPTRPGQSPDPTAVARREPGRRIAYLSLQAVVDGQDTWAAVTEVIKGWERLGWTVDRYFPEYPATGAPGGVGRLLEMRRVQQRLARRLRDYDAIYVRAHQIALPTAYRAAHAGVPIVQECNGPYEDLFIAYPGLRVGRVMFDAMQRWQYRHASAIVSVASGLTEWLKREAGHDRVVTIGNGANVDVFTPDASKRAGLPDRFAVFFGQFPAWQGIATLLEAVKLPSWPQQLPLVFVGDGALRPEVESAVAEMPGRVVYLGRLPYGEVAGVVAHAAVSFVPMTAPERETMFSPLKLYESMACGVPVVASDVIGISEVVTECQCGVLFPAGDANSVALGAAGILADPAAAAQMGRRAREAVVAKYSWRARSEQRARVIEEAIGR
ncbi:MAG: glycosyltransferase family 4 protein [Coriobacteriia bacterium]|nr:glycosyltransferase family 4 protein [Coriobacteriia bacterium]